MQHNALYPLSLQWSILEEATTEKNNQPQNPHHDEFSEVVTASKAHL